MRIYIGRVEDFTDVCFYFLTYLSTDVRGAGDTRAFSFSLFVDEPAAIGAGADCPAAISSGSSGQPNTSFDFP